MRSFGSPEFQKVVFPKELHFRIHKDEFSFYVWECGSNFSEIGSVIQFEGFDKQRISNN